MTVTSKPSEFSEKDWNEASIKEVNEKGREADPMTKYRASKTLAEKGTFTIDSDLALWVLIAGPRGLSAAWEFYAQHKGQVTWDVSVLNPPFVRLLVHQILHYF